MWPFSGNGLRHSTVEYIPLFNPNASLQSVYPRNKQQWLYVVIALLSTMNVVLLGRAWYTYIPAPSLLDSYQILKPQFVVGRQDLVQPPRTDDESRAVVTSLYTDAFAYPVAALGHSLTAADVTARKILMYLPNQVSLKALCIAQAGGWQLHAVPLISPPTSSASGIGNRFGDQYTKLNLWTLDQIGVKAAVYLDADTIVRKKFDELWNLPYDFAAVPDVWETARGFILGFNAGMLFLRPSNDTFTNMMNNLEHAVYPPHEAEQAFLNLYFGGEAVRLPYVYNANLAIKTRTKDFWKALQDDIRIVHYTTIKPFFYSGGIPTREKMQEEVDRSKTKRWGEYKEEVLWWEEAWHGVLENPELEKCFEDDLSW
ncbi:nucleotide-diphospho-sugar transferase [Stereum hirsutum FP-91666 SS1]|uniref:nucleotide-diphospho-sugar transferase n=1 Tax=Stereum hirsutum (strain FP-91666) TaxID=721885 RepID=UPI0004449BBB|nr:nucleotide-diphospho-sugar transferase [Stereum hirsutum FP-91666 SS1]EIM86308.1 nucleotide-diphospho-sugar transferase [Stereum hirsutum FP-91666 SS1]